MAEEPVAKKAFQEIFPQVVRTASHFYEWLSYTKSLRGFGKVVREVGKNWLSQTDAKKLAYQLLKYQQRQGFSSRDALRLFHVKPPTEDHRPAPAAQKFLSKIAQKSFHLQSVLHQTRFKLLLEN